MELTVHELKDKAPGQFDREYTAWCQYACEYDWWGCIEDAFKEKYAPMGIVVDRIYFTGFYSQGDHAGFEGNVNLWTYMKHMKLDEDYPALYQAVLDDGSYMRVTYGRCGVDVEPREDTCGTSPAGVFAALDADTWQSLIESGWHDSGLVADVEELCRDVCYDLWRDLEKEYEYLTSEAAFIESCECNDVKFEIDDEGDEE